MVFRPSFNSSVNNKEDSIYDQESFRTLFLLSLSCILYGISVGINLSSFSLYLADSDLDSSEISNILSLEVLGNIIISPFMLLLIRKFGIYRLVIISLILRGFFLTFFGFSDHELTWSIGMLGFGIAGFCLYTVIFQWINYIARSKFRATYLSIASLCFGIGIPLGPILMIIFDINVNKDSFLISLCVSMLMIIPIFMVDKTKIQNFTNSFIGINQIFRFAYIPIIAAIASEYIFFSIYEFLPLYAYINEKTQYETFLLSSYFGLSGIILGIPFGILIDKFDRVKVMIGFSITVTILIQLIPLVINNILFTILVFAPLSASITGIIVTSLAILGDKFRGDEFVIANTIVHAMSTIGGFAGIRITGNLIESKGDLGFIYSISALFFVFLVLLLFSQLTKKLNGKAN